VLTKTVNNNYNWQPPSVTSIMVNIVYSNTLNSETLWNDTDTANSILLNSNIMVASNAGNLPAGWMLGFETPVGSGYTHMYLSTSGALNYNGRQMTPLNVRFLYAKSTSGGGATVVPQALTWTSVTADGGSMAIASAIQGRFGNIKCVPLTTGLDNQSLYRFIKGGAFYNNAVTNTLIPNFQIPANANALLVKIYFEFNLNSTY